MLCEEPNTMSGISKCSIHSFLTLCGIGSNTNELSCLIPYKRVEMAKKKTNIFSVEVFEFELLLSHLGQCTEVWKEYLVICEFK